MNIKYEAYASFGIPFKVEGDKYLWNFPEEAPSQEVIDAKIAELEKTKYQRDRASQYPSIQDQLDMQYHDQVNGTTTWKDAVAKVKSDNPKPT
jgi:hypothetical protein